MESLGWTSTFCRSIFLQLASWKLLNSTMDFGYGQLLQREHMFVPNLISIESSDNAENACLDNLSKTVPVTEQWGCTKAQVILLNYRWTVKNFSSFCLYKPGEALKSPIFSGTLDGNKKCEWCLEMYPTGWINETKDCMGLFLYLVSCEEGAELLTKYRLSILHNVSGSKSICSEASDRFTPGEAQGWPSFIARKLLFEQNSSPILNNELTIFCEMQVVVGKDHVSGGDLAKREIEKSQKCLSEDLGTLFQNKILADVTLCTSGHEIKAHKAILASRSPVFCAMFEHEMKESRNHKVDIEDIDADVLEKLIQFMYTGTVSDLNKFAECLLIAADKYAISSLKGMCEQSLCATLTVESAATLLMMADYHNAQQLKETTMRYIQGQAARVVETESWKTMVKQFPALVNEVFCTFVTEWKVSE